jgi:hypothetical protein
MTISQKAIVELKQNNRLKAMIAIAHDCTVYTIDRWIRTRDIKHLTTAAALHLDIFKGETGFSTEDILVAEAESA